MDKNTKKFLIFLVAIVGISVAISSTALATIPLPDYSNVTLNLSNHDISNLRYDDNGAYIFFPQTGGGNGSGGGNNALQMSDNNGTNHTGSIIQSGLNGTFFIGDTGTRGWFDNVILMVAVNKAINENFSINIVASGYQWDSVPADEYPDPGDLYYVVGLNDTFTSSDFLYHSTFKPASSPNTPIYNGQNTTSGKYENTFSIMFIDLNVGNLGQNYINQYPPNTFTDNGKIRLNYSISGLPEGSIVAFNVYGYVNQPSGSANNTGVQWTNNVNNNGVTVTG